jgi:hypothetical protein
VALYEAEEFDQKLDDGGDVTGDLVMRIRFPSPAPLAVRSSESTGPAASWLSKSELSTQDGSEIL